MASETGDFRCPADTAVAVPPPAAGRAGYAPARPTGETVDSTPLHHPRCASHPHRDAGRSVGIRSQPRRRAVVPVYPGAAADHPAIGPAPIAAGPAGLPLHRSSGRPARPAARHQRDCPASPPGPIACLPRPPGAAGPRPGQADQHGATGPVTRPGGDPGPPVGLGIAIERGLGGPVGGRGRGWKFRAGVDLDPWRA